MSPRFSVGDHVRTVVENPAGHTRLPQYARGRCGVVETVHDEFMVPEQARAGLPEPQLCAVYTVAFDAAKLWGSDAEPGSSIRLEIWEHYLTAASAVTEEA